MEHTRLWRRWAVAASAVIIAATGLGLGAPASATTDTGLRPVRPCADLVRDYAIPGATAHVTSAEERSGTGEPAHCFVVGHVDPAVEFHLKLPLSTYNGRYLQKGCHGLCGT